MIPWNIFTSGAPHTGPYPFSIASGVTPPSMYSGLVTVARAPTPPPEIHHEYIPPKEPEEEPKQQSWRDRPPLL